MQYKVLRSHVQPFAKCSIDVDKYFHFVLAAHRMLFPASPASSADILRRFTHTHHAPDIKMLPPRLGLPSNTGRTLCYV